MEFYENRAIYLQIAEWVCGRIIENIWNAGDRIPSVREFAAELEVNPNTVSRTYEFLQNEGILFTKRGIGQFVSANARSIALDYLRKIFMENEMPSIIRHIRLLDISPKEWMELYDNNLNMNHYEKKQ